MEKVGELNERGNSREPPAADGVSENVHRRAEVSGASPLEESHHETITKKKRGRPHPRWRVRVVRIDAQKHPEWVRSQANPFAVMAAAARVAEIDAFCARLWARTKKKAA